MRALNDPAQQSSPNAPSPSQTEVPWYRRWLLRVRQTHGGGLYAVGYAVTFIYLEVRSILDELAASTSLINFLSDHLFAFVFRFAAESIANMVQAIVWFLPVVMFKAPLGILGLGIGAYVFDIYLREPVARWLTTEDD